MWGHEWNSDILTHSESWKVRRVVNIKQMAIKDLVILCLGRPACYCRQLLCGYNKLCRLHGNSSPLPHSLFLFLLLFCFSREPALSVFQPMTSFLPPRHLWWDVGELRLGVVHHGLIDSLTHSHSIYIYLLLLLTVVTLSYNKTSYMKTLVWWIFNGLIKGYRNLFMST